MTFDAKVDPDLVLVLIIIPNENDLHGLGSREGGVDFLGDKTETVVLTCFSKKQMCVFRYFCALVQRGPDQDIQRLYAA